ncbi:MAG: hypothetical protein RIM72_04015 [Alphaproteobacteria bacterium]
MRKAAWFGVVPLLCASVALAGGNQTSIIDLGGGVTLQAPIEVQQTPGDGIDSIAGSFSGDGFECRYDHGLYSSDLSDVRNATVEQVRVAGVAARLVSATDEFDGLHVPEIAKSSRGARRLTISCQSADEATRSIVRDILMSLQIESVE